MLRTLAILLVLCAAVFAGDDPSDAEVRRVALRTAWQLVKGTPEEAQIVPHLRKGLADRSWEVREAAARIAAEMEPVPKKLVPALARALMVLDPPAEKKAPELVERTRRWITLALKRAGRNAEPAASALAQAITYRGAEVRQNAALALTAIGGAAREAEPELRKGLADKDPDVRLVAAGALAGVGARDPATEKALRRRLEDADARVRVAAAQALGAMGDKARPAVAALTEAKEKDPDADVRKAAAAALEKISAAGPPKSRPPDRR